MEYSVSFAQRSDELELKRLFLNCFDDTLGFVNMFLVSLMSLWEILRLTFIVVQVSSETK